MVAFLALMYGVYTAALVIFGILLRTGVFPGDAPFGGTVVPAVVAAGVMAVFALMALIPQDVERRIASFAGGYRRQRYLLRLAKGPATIATGVRTAIAFVRHPQRRRPGGDRRGGLLGGEHRRALGELRGLRRRTCRSRCSCRASSWAWRPT